ncbi:hypothetical protein HIM_11502 [Hirsutella minnesotensis 3608]|uniref:Uncharacterized protein n=1 Tax=Hirsutella minnesotensis 3608 TaxID=1043627 RepID=A0A0F7ZWK1_9HYPO|nr:hypothetical protein HIM_11502 [Hirsutella minnesotensis 3608]
MAPIDYSKWDKCIDTDSEPEPSAAKSAPPPVNASPPLDTSASQSDAGKVEAVVVRCEVEKRRVPHWSAVTIPEDHAIFLQPVSPIPALIEVPLVLPRVGTDSVNRADLDNQIATYLNIDANSGFAPPVWESHVGTILNVRSSVNA